MVCIIYGMYGMRAVRGLHDVCDKHGLRAQDMRDMTGVATITE